MKLISLLNNSKKILFLIACILFLFFNFPQIYYSNDKSTKTKKQVKEKNTNKSLRKYLLRSGWFKWKPYSHLRKAGDKNTLTGLDIELGKLIFNKSGFDITFKYSSWKEQLKNLKNGSQDLILGAFILAPLGILAYGSYFGDELILNRTEFYFNRLKEIPEVYLYLVFIVVGGNYGISVTSLLKNRKK